MKNNYRKKIIASMLAISSFTGQVALAAPEEIIAHKPIMVWDYHEVHYTKDGIERVKPEITSFDTSNTEKALNEKSVPKMMGRDTKIGYDALIEISIESDMDRQWFENIYKVVKVPEHTNNPSLEEQIEFRKNDNKIILSKESRPLSLNGQHKIKVYSKDLDFGFVFVNIMENAPELRIQADFQAVVGQDILFELRNFNYGITNPIYEVSLDGKVLEGNCVDYHIVSNLIRLENSGIIMTEGKHRLVVRAKGFEDAVLDFIVKQKINAYVQPEKNHEEELKNKVAFALEGYDLDSVSSATSGGGGGGSSIMPAKLIFDFDLLSNAYILRNLGMATRESEKVIELWESSSKEAARKKGEDEFYEWAAYKNQLMKEEIKGNYLSFDDYIKREDAEKTKNRPYNVKYVLEDGLYGKTTLFARTNDKALPKIDLVKAKYMEDILIRSEDDKWINSISNIKLGGYTSLDKKEYSIENNIIRISKDRFSAGNNRIIIEAKGYADYELEFIIEKEEVKPKLTREFNFGEDLVVDGLTKDYIESIRGISINGKYLLSESAGGTSGTYRFDGKDLIIFKSNFKDSSKKILKLESSSYGDREIEIELKGQVPAKEDSGKALPIGLVGSLRLKDDEDLIYTIGSDFSKSDREFKKALKEGVVEIEGKVIDFDFFEEFGSYKIKINRELLPNLEEFTLDLKAKAYEEKEVKVKFIRKEIKEKEEEIKEDDKGKEEDKLKETPKLVFVKSENNILKGKVFHIDIISEDGEANKDEEYLRDRDNFQIYVNEQLIDYMSYSLTTVGKSKAKAKLEIEGRNIRDILKKGKNTIKIVHEGYINRLIEVE